MKKHLIVALAMLLPGCGILSSGIDSRTLPQKNPVLYDFHAPLPHVRECIRGIFGGAKAEMSLELAENLVVLDSKGKAIGPSPVYSQDGVPLPVAGKFHLSMTSTQSGTRVEIYALETAVLLDGGAKRVSVAPTTVEEYRILLKIGDCLGEKGMPLLILPNTK